MKNLKSYAHYFIIGGFVLLVLALSNLGGNNAVWADSLHQGCGGGTIPDPSCLTPQPGGSGSSGAGSGAAQIIGTVTDLSTGKAGAGIAVKINNDIVTTDSFGDYSLSGVAPGEYVVELVLEGGALPAQEPVLVYVGNPRNYVVNLQYYSLPPAEGIQLKQIGPIGKNPDESKEDKTAADAKSDSSSQTAQTDQNGRAGGNADTTTTEATEASTETAQPVSVETSATTDETTAASSTETNQTPSVEQSPQTQTNAETTPQANPETLPQTGAQHKSVWEITALLGIILLLGGLSLSVKTIRPKL